MLRPVLWLLNSAGNLVLRILGVTPKNEVTSVFSRNEVAAMVSESLRADCSRRPRGAAAGRPASSGACSVANLVIPLESIEPARGGHRRAGRGRRGRGLLPVPGARGRWATTGYYHIKDLLDSVHADRYDPIPSATFSTLPCIGADEPLRQALTSMQDSGAHCQPLTDEAGQVIGIVTLEDMLEELVGQIPDDSRVAA